MNELLSRVLKTGLYLSLIVMALGILLVVVQHPAQADVRALRLPELLGGLVRGSGVAVLDLGLVLLMLTPVARVVAALIGYTAERNRLFAFISAAVLLVLTVSFLVSMFTGIVAG